MNKELLVYMASKVANKLDDYYKNKEDETFMFEALEFVYDLLQFIEENTQGVKLYGRQ